ncbi:MAG: CapA family protein [Eggerthellaceae bacterium]|nr:CapA family protein [Eggerthellaceae bacterium]
MFGIAQCARAGAQAGDGAGDTHAAEQTADDAASGDGAAAPAERVELTVTALGDCTLGTDADFDVSTNFTSVYKKQGSAYFFKNVLPYTGSDQLTVGNCEGTFTTSTDIQEKSFNFKGPTEYTQIFTDGSVEAVSVANNHSHDFGTQGYTDTIDALDAAGIANFGFDRTSTYDVDGIKVGLFGIRDLSADTDAQSQMTTAVQKLREEGCQLLVVNFHWGVEGNHTPESSQVDLAHAAIDAGCDLVIGGHPHVLQGVERYKDRYILYSMGNFCFGGNANPKDKNTMMFQQTFVFENGSLVTDADALSKAWVVPCSVSSVTSRNNYQPTPLTDDAGEAVVKKLNGYSGKLSGDAVTFSTALGDDGRAAVEAEES